ncbi:MAG: hypothetical protein GY854_18145 [Deltaproteobacteria bacterium]|nr:hypothetical protein [Deltaproteobacteria bacterium]
MDLKAYQRDRLIEVKYRDWIRWQIIFPLVIVLAIGICVNYVAGVDAPVVDVIGGCDLLLFVGTVLIGVATRLRHVELERLMSMEGGAGFDSKLDAWLEWSRVIGIFILLIFVIARTDVIKGILITGDVVSIRGWLYMTVNVSLLLAGLAFSRYAMFYYLEIETREGNSNPGGEKDG